MYLVVYNPFSGQEDATFTGTETVSVCMAEWEHAFVFFVFTDRYRPSGERHTSHFVIFVAERVRAYRVVINLAWDSFQLSLR